MEKTDRIKAAALAGTILLFVAAIAGYGASLSVAPNGRYFQTAAGKPFFWLGDTAWLLLKKCTREETIAYLETRRRQGFNVVQVMVVHDIREPKNAYGALSVDGGDVSRPRTTPGTRFGVGEEYDFWDHLDWTLAEAAKRGIYVALVPVWGSNVKIRRGHGRAGRSLCEVSGRKISRQAERRLAKRRRPSRERGHGCLAGDRTHAPGA